MHNASTTAYPVRLHEHSTYDRPSRIAGIRQQIADGTYETPDKLSVVAEKLMREWADEQINRPSKPAPFAFLKRFAATYVPPQRRVLDGDGFDWI